MQLNLGLGHAVLRFSESQQPYQKCQTALRTDLLYMLCIQSILNVDTVHMHACNVVTCSKISFIKLYMLRAYLQPAQTSSYIRQHGSAVYVGMVVVVCML